MNSNGIDRFKNSGFGLSLNTTDASIKTYRIPITFQEEGQISEVLLQQSRATRVLLDSEKGAAPFNSPEMLYKPDTYGK